MIMPGASVRAWALATRPLVFACRLVDCFALATSSSPPVVCRRRPHRRIFVSDNCAWPWRVMLAFAALREARESDIAGTREGRFRRAGGNGFLCLLAR